MEKERSLPVLLQVRGFKDRGGLPQWGPDAAQHRQFAEGLVRYLQGEAKDRFFVGSAPRGMETQTLILEGELSRSESGAGGSYLCILRLKDDHTDRWVAQWAGVADNFRFLYGNLTGAEGVSAQGLLGDLGSAVLAFLVDSSNPRRSETRPARILAATPPPEASR